MTDVTVILYLHIPKTGGTTLNSCIYEHWHDPGEYYVDGDGFLHAGIYYYPTGFFQHPDDVVPQSVRNVLSRGDLRAVVGHFSFGIHEYLSKPSAYVTILRHPVERVWSLYNHLYRRGHPVGIVEFMNNSPYAEVDNDQTRRISGVEPGPGGCTHEILERAKENLRTRFTVVGLTERFDETLLLLKRRFSWPGTLSYYPKNENSQKPAASTLPSADVDSILQRNELDLELYQFASGLMDEAIEREGPTFRDELRAFVAEKAAWQRQVEKQWAAPAAHNDAADAAATFRIE